MTTQSDTSGETSDGYHTFNELYEFRLLYNAAFFNELSRDLENVYKSWHHADAPTESIFGEDWFIVTATLPTGQISNHYPPEDWDLFQIPEREVAEQWDGHTAADVAGRLRRFILGNDLVAPDSTPPQTHTKSAPDSPPTVDIDEIRKQLEELEVPKFVIFIVDELKVETTNLVEKTVDEIIDIFTAWRDAAVVEALVKELQAIPVFEVPNVPNNAASHVINRIQTLKAQSERNV